MFEYFIILTIVIGLSEFVKRINILTRHWIPLINLILAFCLCLAYFGASSFNSVVTGISLGLIATGLCSTIYHTVLIFYADL